MRHSQFLKSLKQNADDLVVLSLIADMLQWDPKAGPSSQNALKHRCSLGVTDHGLQDSVKRQRSG
jgi:hypothetical protein